MRAGVLSCLLCAACTSGPGRASARYSQVQINAIETREVMANYDETFSAAASALLDAGYTISLSDKDGGLLTGRRKVDKTVARMFVSQWIRDHHFAITIKLRKLSSKMTSARVKLAFNGEARVDKETVDQIWVLMQRQVLMNEPPNIDLTPGATKS